MLSSVIELTNVNKNLLYGSESIIKQRIELFNYLKV